MNAMKALEQRYSGMLILAKNFLQTQSKNKNGSSLPKDRVRHIKNMGGQCPQCGVPLEGGNCNTEHIHDLSLGGENTLGNRVLICRMCNDYRNKMCQGVLGPPRYCNGYPGNWRTIKEYLIWSAVTIDDGFEAGKRIPEIHEKFLEYSTGGRDYSNKATRYFGRCSEWEIGDSMRANPTIRKPGLMTRFLDTIFGYEPKPVVISDKPKPAPTIVKEEAKEIIAAKKKPEKPAGSESKHVKTTKSPSLNDLNECCREFLKVITKEMTLAATGNAFKDHLKRIGKDEMTMKQFAVICGYPKKKSLLKIFESDLNEFIEVRKEGTKTILLPLKYPIWHELNNSSKGIKLPREPKTMYEIYLLLIPIIKSGSSQGELLIEFSNFNSLTQSRRKRILSQIKRALFHKGEESEFWHFPNLSYEELNQKLETSVKEGNGWKIPDRGKGFNWAVTEYFRNVRLHLDDEEE